MSREPIQNWPEFYNIDAEDSRGDLHNRPANYVGSDGFAIISSVLVVLLTVVSQYARLSVNVLKLR